MREIKFRAWSFVQKEMLFDVIGGITDYSNNFDKKTIK